MSKLSKFIRTPRLFILDAIEKRTAAERGASAESLDETHSPSPPGDGLTHTYVFGFSPWKTYMKSWFPERKLSFLPKSIKEEEFSRVWKKRILRSVNPEIFIWGFKVDFFVLKFARENGIKTYFVEDGFIRSIGLGATRTPPFSLTLDSQTPYFDARGPSDLEDILSTYDFESDQGLMDRAESLMQRLISTGLSKYNHAKQADVNEIYGPKTKRRILVVGQVEGDASIQYGCAHGYTNNDLVYIAAIENPDAQIIYKPHPDVLNGHREAVTNPAHVRHICKVVDVDLPLAQAFETIDRVYTITSQAGFEARMRGIPVTTLGCPFYSGWGLTDDRQANPRRSRKLSVVQVFAAAYILYPKYFDPIYKKPLTAEQAVDQMLHLLRLNQEFLRVNDVTSNDTDQEHLDQIDSEDESSQIGEIATTLALISEKLLRLQLAQRTPGPGLKAN